MEGLPSLLGAELASYVSGVHQSRGGQQGGVVLWTSTSSPGSMRPELGRTQYLHDSVSAKWGGSGGCGRVLLGGCGFDLVLSAGGSAYMWHEEAHGTRRPAGLLTLKATGSECGFLSRSVCETSCWKGPARSQYLCPLRHSTRVVLTLEAELRGIEFDGHGEGACDVGGGGRRLVISWGCGSAIDRGACDSSAQWVRAGQAGAGGERSTGRGVGSTRAAGGGVVKGTAASMWCLGDKTSELARWPG